VFSRLQTQADSCNLTFEIIFFYFVTLRFIESEVRKTQFFCNIR
jgi:hypothetical protein